MESVLLQTSADDHDNEMTRRMRKMKIKTMISLVVLSRFQLIIITIIIVIIVIMIIIIILTTTLLLIMIMMLLMV